MNEIYIYFLGEWNIILVAATPLIKNVLYVKLWIIINRNNFYTLYVIDIWHSPLFFFSLSLSLYVLFLFFFLLSFTFFFSSSLYVGCPQYLEFRRVQTPLLNYRRASLWRHINDVIVSHVSISNWVDRKIWLHLVSKYLCRL